MKMLKKRVLLLNPYSDVCHEQKPGDESPPDNSHLFLETPLGVGYVYTYAKNNMLDTTFSVIDAQAMLFENAHKGMDYNWQILLDKITDFHPTVIGIGAYYFTSADIFHETCKRIKEVLPDVIIVAGGNYPTDAQETILKDHNVSYIIISEGELAFYRFLKAFFNGEDLTSVPNLRYIDQTGKIHFNQVELISDISTIPIPDRSPLPMYIYSRGRNMLDRIYGPGNYKALSMTISRGCAHACTFCNAVNFWGRIIRYRDTESVLDEMQILKEEYGADVILINDDNFLLDKKKATNVMKGMLKRKLDLKWVAHGGTSVRAFNDDDFLDLAIESGYCCFNLAIESSSDKTLRKIKKPVQLKQVHYLVDRIHTKYPDMWINGYLIVGFPFETKQDIVNTLMFGQELELDWYSISIFKLLPNTPLYQDYLDNILIEKNNGGGNGSGKGENNENNDNKDWLFQNHYENKHLWKINLNGVDWDRKWLYEKHYEFNLKINFLNNRNIKYSNFAQALRDFEYIISIVPGHALAYRQAALVADKMGNSKKACDYAQKEKKIMEQENEFTLWYEKLGLST